MCGCGTWGQGSVVATAVPGQWLGTVILEGFSHLKNSDSIIAGKMNLERDNRDLPQ